MAIVGSRANQIGPVQFAAGLRTAHPPRGRTSLTIATHGHAATDNDNDNDNDIRYILLFN
ncbi:hypothetical protein ACO34A_02040 [Rhizobium sp. ACO-34A]|nr:hypothetical protein ACO34A_02040 [Rhizobium sp. ACO-34A]